MGKRSSIAAMALALAVVAIPLAGYADSGATGSAADSAPAAGARDGADAGANGAAASVSFAAADRDGNGFVDESEARQVPGLDIAGVDSNNDGRLSRAEFEAGTQGAAGIDAKVPPGSGHTDGATGEFGQTGPDPRGGEDLPNPDRTR